MDISTQERLDIVKQWYATSCINCADFHNGSENPDYISWHSTCQSEEVFKVFGKYQDAGIAARSTVFTGCRFFREKKSMSEIVKMAFPQDTPL